MKKNPVTFKDFSDSLLSEIQEKAVCHVHAAILGYFFVDDTEFQIKLGKGHTKEEKLGQYCKNNGITMMAIPDFAVRGIFTFIKTPKGVEEGHNSGMEQLEARLSHTQEVEGSSPSPATDSHG